MSVVGFDFGNLNLLIGVAAKGGIDVILNDASNRQTATCVSFQGKQRFLGDAAAAMARSNVTNTISCMKLLVGRKFDSADVQRELKKIPFKASRLPNGGVGINLLYNDEELIVSAEQILSMMLVKAKEIAAKANNNVNIGDMVLAVPNWFTDSQRRGILNACEIAQINCLKVTNELNAIALSYGIFKSAKKLFSETEPIHIMFIDIGYTSYSVTVVDFIQENMKVRSTVSVNNLGGRDFDDAIIGFLCETFKKKTGIDVSQNFKSILKLQVAAEKAKKTLSPNGVNEAVISVECLSNDKDLSCKLTREEFEKLIESYVQRLEEPILRALQESGLTKKDLHEIEIVGGSSRVNCIKRRLGEILELDLNAMNYGLKTTMNSDEAVARGCTLQSALLSSRMKVKTFHITDLLYYGIVAEYESSSLVSAESKNGSEEKGAAEDDYVPMNIETQSTSQATSLYLAGDEIPRKPRRLTFRKKTSDFSITLRYDNASREKLPQGEDTLIGLYTIKVPSGSVSSDVRVTFNIDKNSCVYIQSAQLMEELPIEVIPTPVVPVTTETESKSDLPVQLVEPPKKKYRKIDLEVISELHTMNKEEKNKALELEASLSLEDRLITETADKKNELESYIYTIRDRLDGPLKQFVLDNDRQKLQAAATTAEDWLYNEGYDATKSQYSKKLDELKSNVQPVEFRFNEHSSRPPAVEALKKQLELAKNFASSYDEVHSHITDEERNNVRNAINTAESWLYDMIAKQGDLNLTSPPVLTVDSITKKRNELFAISNPIMTKPKPKPVVVPESKVPETKEDEKKSDDKRTADSTEETSSAKGDSV